MYRSDDGYFCEFQPQWDGKRHFHRYGDSSVAMKAIIIIIFFFAFTTMTKKISSPFCGYLFYTSLNMKNLIFHFVPSISLLLSSLAISEGSYSVLVPSAREVCIAIKAPENKSSQIRYVNLKMKICHDCHC